MTPNFANKLLLAIALGALVILAGIDVAGKDVPWWLYGLGVVLVVMALVPWIVRRRQGR